MAHFSHSSISAVIAFSLCFLCACEGNDSGKAALQPVAELPEEFVDTLGTTWLCPNEDFANHVTGAVHFDEHPQLQRTDILHLALLQQLDEQFTVISSVCINNILSAPIAFSVAYDESLLSSGARYFISANYFSQVTDGNLYHATHKPNGYTEVISNGIENTDIRLDSY